MGDEGRHIVGMISQDGELIARAGDAVAAAGLVLQVHETSVASVWSGSRAVLIGSDAVSGLRRTHGARRSEALVVGRDGDEAALWQAAGDLAAAGAVGLPAGGAWLVHWLRDRELPRDRGVVAAVFSAAGGVGASTLAAAIAVTAARAGLQPLLIDAHPGPAGVDLLLGEGEAVDHWSRFAAVRGPLEPEELASLPRSEGVRCLGWAGAREVPLWQDALGSVIGAALREHHLVVVDAGLHAPPVAELPRRTTSIMVVPATWRGVLAARSRLSLQQGAFEDDPVIVLRDVGGRADPRGWEHEFSGHRVVHLGFDAAVIDDEDQGRPPGTRPRSPVSRCARRILGALAERSAAA